MQKSPTHYLMAGALAAAAAALASPAGAGGCSYYPGVFAAPIRPALCVYQGDYMVQQWASHDGPALIAPQDVYAPSRTYVQSAYRVEPVVAIEPAPVVYHRVNRVVSVQDDLPRSQGRSQVVRARAVVRIYGPQRMDIRLYRD
jgi:hypothetical protein